MKIFHLSDLHIGMKLYNRDLRADQEHILGEVITAAEEYKPDAVVIAGDIYDRAVPSAESVSLFDSFITGLTQALPESEIMMISGNHDSAPRVNVYRSILSRQHIHMIGLPPQVPEEHIEKVTLRDSFGEADFWLLPFVRPSMVRRTLGAEDESESLTYDQAVRRLIEREKIDTSRRNILVSHQFFIPAGSDPAKAERTESETVTVGNIDSIGADVLEPFDYAALGHIHKPMAVAEPQYRYCGTPLAYSVSEAGQQKGIILLELGEKGSAPEIQVIPLEPLHQVRVIKDTLEKVLAQSSEDYVLVIVTDKDDLDVIDMQDRVRSAFPNILELRRETAEPGAETVRSSTAAGGIPEPFEICRDLLGETDEADEEILRDVINTVRGAGE